MSVTVRVIFVGGLGRSGSTLLERLLGELPGVVPLGEVIHLWARGAGADEPCGCGAPFTRCAFWREVGERAFGGWPPALTARVLALRHRVDRTRRIPALSRLVRPARHEAAGRAGRREGVAEYAAVYARLYEAAARTAGAAVVIDSSKHASLAFCLRAGGAPIDLRVVHVVRDPRAVACSWARPVLRPEDGTPMTRWRPGRTTLHWLAQNLAFRHLARQGVPMVRVRYEDLVDAPRRTLHRLVRRLGLAGGPGREGHDRAGRPAFVRRGVVTLSAAHTVSGNPMRFAVGRVALTRDDAWRARLPRRHRRLVTALTWPLCLRYGYRLGAGGPR